MNNDEQIKNWIREAGRQKPSSGFSSRVMAAIESGHASAKSYVPVIPPFVMKLIVGGLAALYAGVIFFPASSEDPAGPGYMDQVRQVLPTSPEWSAPQFSLPEIPLDIFAGHSVLAYSLLALAAAIIIMALQYRFGLTDPQR